jgi:hypothetical protein
MGVIRRIAGMVVRPRATLTGLAVEPRSFGTWLTILLVWALCGAWLLSSDVGRQAVIDERVRVVETFGGTVGDADYARLLEAPPWSAYFTSGSRLLLTPPVTLLVAVGIWLAARAERAETSFAAALAVVVHASVVLAIGQLVATPLHYVRESLTSPLNLAAVLPLMEEGTMPARFFGTLDFFVLWWLGLLAIGLSVLTRRGAAKYAWRLAGVSAVVAGLVAAVIAVTGGF